MRVLVDYRPALRARTGVGEYMHELVRAYAAAHPDSDVSVFTSSWKDRPAADTAAQLGARVIDRRVPVAVLNLLWHRLEWPPIERLAGPFDIVHAAHPLLIPARRAAQVVTVHDLYYLSHPERTTAEIRRDYAALTGPHARRAHAVITPSLYTRGLVIDTLGVPPERVYACPPGAPRWPALGRSPNVPRDGYVLFMGTLEPRKNVGLLLDAYERLTARRDVPRLVLAGGVALDAAPWLERINRPPLNAWVTHAGYVAHHDRERLYRGARTLVLPSFDEGFGLPALEAMAAGVPVIVSNRGALPEVVGDAGVIVDPSDPDDLAAAIERLTDDQAWAEGRAGAGIERARAFTWESSARRLGAAYVEAMERRALRRGRASGGAIG